MPGIGAGKVNRRILTCILHEGNETQGKSGNQGRSFAIGRQIFSEFIQAQIAFPYFHEKSMQSYDINDFFPWFVPPSCNMQVIGLTAIRL
jgi:hypothetical protein